MRVKTILTVIAIVLLAACSGPTTAPPDTGPIPEASPPSSAVPDVEVVPSPTAWPTPASVPSPEALPAGAGVSEYPVTTIPLSGPVDSPDAEVSGLAWYGDYLIFLPQYPDFAPSEGDGTVYALDRADILAFLDGVTAGPLEPLPIPFSAPGLARSIDDFEGYEAIAFAGDRAFLTIEASPGREMRGYLVSGTMAPDLSGLALDTTTVAEIRPQAGVGNKSDEALLIAGDAVVTLYEVNGAALNPAPVAHLFDASLAPGGTVAFPNVEYRITDATALDEQGRFWATNFFFPLEREQLAETDPLVERYGEGASHLKSDVVERLVEFQYSEGDITLVDAPPIQIELLPLAARNWEGLVRLDGRGFLLVTDLFPGTILGFVPLPEEH